MTSWRRSPVPPQHRPAGAGRRRGVVVTLLALVGASLMLVTTTTPAVAAPIVGDVPQASWRVNGRVYATQIIGNTVVVGGSFTTATSPTGENVARRNLAAFRLDNGQLIRTWSADAGSVVRALDHDGTWLYVGGAFGKVGGVTAGRLARVRVSDGWVDPQFKVSADNVVRALDVRGGALWVGGLFTTVNGVARQRAAKLNLVTGAVDPSFNVRSNGPVFGIVKNPVTDNVYLAGNFTQVGGVARTGVAAVSSTTGALRSTVFSSSHRPTYGLDVNDAGTRLFGAGGSAANTMSAWSTSTGARVWRHVTMGDIQATIHYKGKVYFGFHDGYQGNTAIKVLAADEATGALDPAFRPRFNKFWGVFALAASDAGVVVGGEFTTVSGVAAQGFARFRATGTTASPPPPTTRETTYLNAETSWRYWDGGNLADGWQAAGTNDAAWRTGAGHFGYGDGDETTLLGWGGTARHITAYFRTRFDLAALPSAATLELVADDGAVVHVNGVAVVRDNMPSGAITATTRAASNRSGSAENVARRFSVPVSALRLGSNTIAVEVHQDAPGSSDLSFGAALTGTVPATG